MRMVDADAELVESRLQAGAIECPDCGAGMRPWGHARERTLRDGEGRVRMRPRRSICRRCSTERGRWVTHVLLPVVVLLRRGDAIKVIGEALSALADKRLTRTQVAVAAGAPADTVRGWWRRFKKRAEEIRQTFTEAAHRWDPELGAITARNRPVQDAMEAIGLAAAAALRALGPQPLWSLVAGVTGGLLLSNTSCPFPNPR